MCLVLTDYHVLKSVYDITHTPHLIHGCPTLTNIGRLYMCLVLTDYHVLKSVYDITHTPH